MSEGKEMGQEAYPQLRLENQLCFPLYAAAREIVSQYTPLLKPLKLTYTQYVVCLALWEHGRMTVGNLGRALRLDCGTLTPLLKKMEEQGLVTRTRARNDERVVEVEMTPDGWALRDRARDIPMQMGRCVKLTQEEAQTLYGLLYKLLG